MNETVDDRRQAPAGWSRGGLAVLSLGALSVGLLALLPSVSFYEVFPLSGFLLDLRLVQISLIAYLVYSVPHLLFHLTQTRAFTVGDDLANLVLLGPLAMLPAAILIRSGLQDRNHREEGR